MLHRDQRVSFIVGKLLQLNYNFMMKNFVFK